MANDEFRIGRRQFAGAAGLLLAGGPTTARTTTEKGPEPRWTVDVGDGDRIRVPDVAGGLVLVESADALVALSTDDGAERWRFDGVGDRPALLATADGTAFVHCDGTLYAVETGDGSERWRAATDRTRCRIAGETVYLGGRGVAALDAADGSERWRSTDRWDVRGLRVHDGTVYATGRGVVYAFAAEDGTKRWTFVADADRPLGFDGGSETFGIQWTTGTVADGTVLVRQSGVGPLYALSAADGVERWRIDDGTGIQYGVRGGTVYAVGGGSVRAVKAGDGSERWRTALAGESDLGRLSLAGDHLLVEGSETLYGISSARGKTKWTVDTGERVLSEVTEDVVVVGSASGTHTALSPDDGEPFWEYDPQSRVTWYPQVADATVFLATERGRVHAIPVPVNTPIFERVSERVGPLPLAFGATLLGGAVVAGGYRLLNDDAESVPDPVPSTLDAFEFEAPLGERGDRSVHVATWPGGEGRTVAVKRFSGAVDGFEAAAETWARLGDRPGVVTLHEWGTDPEPWLATAHASRGSLGESLDSIGVDAGLDVVADAAEIVHAAHRDGVVHGALHLDNVFPTEDGPTAAAVGDWGVARGRDAADAPHVAPERRDGKSLDPRADVFALGVLAYRVATGTVPYPDGFERAPTPPSEVNRALPAALDDAILRALAIDPSDRYETALAFRDVLRWAAFVR